MGVVWAGNKKKPEDAPAFFWVFVGWGGLEQRFGLYLVADALGGGFGLGGVLGRLGADEVIL